MICCASAMRRFKKARKQLAADALQRGPKGEFNEQCSFTKVNSASSPVFA
jgi:hypothetical protein